jgi:hypothetical protein
VLLLTSVVFVFVDNLAQCKKSFTSASTQSTNLIGGQVCFFIGLCFVYLSIPFLKSWCWQNIVDLCVGTCIWTSCRTHQSFRTGFSSCIPFLLLLNLVSIFRSSRLILWICLEPNCRWKAVELESKSCRFRKFLCL